MKKIILSMAAVASMMMVACGNKADQQTVDASEPGAVEVIEAEEITVSDAEAPSILDNIKNSATKENVEKGIAYVKSLINSGKLAEAKNYLDQIKPYAEKVGLRSALASVETALDKADGLGSNVKAAADSAVNAGKQKVADAANNAAKKGADAINNALGGLGK